MKKNILKIIVAFLLVTSSSLLSASSFTYNTRSLVGIEGSYNYFDVENDAPVTPLRETMKYAGAGLKIGAQTDNYRLFLSARNNFIDGYDYAYSFGAEVQYLMNFSSVANFYLGASGGYMNLRFVDVLNASREVSSPYVGGDIGFNFHMGDALDLELGARVVKLSDTKHLQSGLTYNFDNITSAYMSIIFKYSMDEY